MQSQSVQVRPSQSRPDFKNILLATDFSDAFQIALHYAISVGGVYHSNILIAHIIRHGALTPVHGESSPSRAEEAMSVYLAKASFTGVQHEVLIQTGEILPVISGLVEKHVVDLIVAGTHERKGASRLLLGSVAEQIFRGVPCPVLTVGPDVDQERSAKGEVKEIVYATDFAAGSLLAWPYALSIAEAYGAHLTLVHILSNTIPSFASEGTEASFQEQLKCMVPPDVRISSDAVVRFGEPTAGVLEVAKERDANLIVMGVRQNVSWSAAHLPWAIAHQVVCHSHCPVLTVRG
jgi:nucleotide-binding universal stress UspA family protein